MQILKPQDYNVLSVQRFSYPANRKCIALYTVNTTQTIADSAETVVNFMTKVTDIYSAVTTGAAWKFTCPAGKAGWFNIISMLVFNAEAWAAINRIYYLVLSVNGSNVRAIDRGYTQAAATFGVALCGSTDFYLDEDEYCQVEGYQNSGSTLTIPNAPDSVWVAIARHA